MITREEALLRLIARMAGAKNLEDYTKWLERQAPAVVINLAEGRPAHVDAWAKTKAKGLF